MMLQIGLQAIIWSYSLVKARGRGFVAIHGQQNECSSDTNLTGYSCHSFMQIGRLCECSVQPSYE